MITLLYTQLYRLKVVKLCKKKEQIAITNGDIKRFREESNSAQIVVKRYI